MKKRFLTLAMAGVLATAAVAPAAMAADTGKATVSYVAGAGVPGDSTGGYYVLFPTDLTFSKQDDTPTHTVELLPTDTTAGLPADLEVEVSVKATNGVLKNTSYSDIAYKIDYTDGGSQNVTVNDATAKKFTLDETNDVVTGTGSITGDVGTYARGTAFSDTLTFTLSQTAPVTP